MSIRRPTLASIDGPNTATNPQKLSSSAIKTSTTNTTTQAMTSTHRSARQSLAPKRQSVVSGPYAGGEDGHGSSSRVGNTPAASFRTSRQSVMGPPHNAGSMGRASTASAGGIGATPNHRRSTMGARQSLAPGAFPPPAAAAKPPPNTDPRPLRSREYMAEMKARVHEFAERTGFAHAGYRGIISLDSPTQSIFLGLFRHIFNSAIDRSYTFQIDAKKPEEEVMTVLQEYRYPSMGDITKMLLGSASSHQYWPKALGILDWMVSLAHLAAHIPSGPLDREQMHNENVARLVRAHAQATNDLNRAPKTMSPEERGQLQSRLNEASAELREAEYGPEDGADHDRWFYPFLWHCYERFWEGDDQYPDEISKLEELFQRRNGSVRSDVERLQLEVDAYKADLQRLQKTRSPLTAVQEENDMIKGDIVKFIKFRDDSILPKIDKLKLTISRLEENRVESTRDMENLRANNKSLSEQVASQEMSSEDFDRLSNERAAMMAEKDRLDADTREIENQRYDLELANANMQQRLEERLKVFNPLGTKVGLFPLKVRRAHGGPGEELLDEIDLTVGQASLLHPGLDLKGDVRSKISDIRRRVDKAQRRAIEEKVERQEKYDEVCERLHQVREQESEVHARLEAIKESIDSITQLTDEETRAANNDQYHQDRKVQQAQQAGHRQLAEAETRLVELRAHQRNVGTLAAASLERYKDELCAAVEECVGLKARVGECMEEIGLKVGVEFEREEEVQGGGEEDEGEEEDLPADRPPRITDDEDEEMEQ